MNSDLDDRSLRELIILMHDTDMASLPDDNSISGKYVLSDRFYQKMNRLIKKVNYKRIASEVSRYAVACVAVTVTLSPTLRLVPAALNVVS